MAFSEGDRVYDRAKSIYGTVIDISDQELGLVTVRYDSDDIGLIEVANLEVEVFNAQMAGEALAKSLTIGVTAEKPTAPWKTTRQLLKYAFAFWYKDIASKTVRENQERLNQILAAAAVQLGYAADALIGIEQYGWENKQPDLPEVAETVLQWQEAPVEQLAEGLRQHILRGLTSAAKQATGITDWRIFVREAYNDWMLHNAPESVKNSAEKTRQIQELVSKTGLDIFDISSSDWFLRNQGKEIKPFAREDWVSEIEKQLTAPEPVEEALKTFKIGQDVYDPVRGKRGYVIDIAGTGEYIFVRYYDGTTGRVRANELYEERPPTTQEMNQMFKWERQAAKVSALLQKAQKAPIVLQSKPDIETKRLLLQLVRKGFLKARKVKDKIVFSTVKRAQERPPVPDLKKGDIVVYNGLRPRNEWFYPQKWQKLKVVRDVRIGDYLTTLKDYWVALEALPDDNYYNRSLISSCVQKETPFESDEWRTSNKKQAQERPPLPDFKEGDIVMWTGEKLRERGALEDPEEDWNYPQEGQKLRVVHNVESTDYYTGEGFWIHVSSLYDDERAYNDSLPVSLLRKVPLIDPDEWRTSDKKQAQYTAQEVIEAMYDDRWNYVEEILHREASWMAIYRDEEKATLLHHAAYLCHFPTIKQLIKGGADVNARDIFDSTPLHNTVEGAAYAPEIVQYLLQQGANPCIENHRGQTALALAISQPSPDPKIICYLEQASPCDLDDWGLPTWRTSNKRQGQRIWDWRELAMTADVVLERLKEEFPSIQEDELKEILTSDFDYVLSNAYMGLNALQLFELIEHIQKEELPRIQQEELQEHDSEWRTSNTKKAQRDWDWDNLKETAEVMLQRLKQKFPNMEESWLRYWIELDFGYHVDAAYYRGDALNDLVRLMAGVVEEREQEERDEEWRTSQREQPTKKVSSDGTIRYTLNGRLHRKDGPAIIHPDGSQEYFINGQYHREDGPAVIFSNGTRHYLIRGGHHREDGPAVIWSDGSVEYWINGKLLTQQEFLAKQFGGEEWRTSQREQSTKSVTSTGIIMYFLHGQSHREDGPAIIHPNGTQEYFLHGERHREDGPAVIFPDGATMYYINGKELTKRRFDYMQFQKETEQEWRTSKNNTIAQATYSDLEEVIDKIVEELTHRVRQSMPNVARTTIRAFVVEVVTEYIKLAIGQWEYQHIAQEIYKRVSKKLRSNELLSSSHKGDTDVKRDAASTI